MSTPQVIDQHTGEVIEFDKAAAERRAERITLRLDAIADNYRAVLPMIREAIAKRDDLALGYRSPGDYVSDRFGQSLAGLGIEVRRQVVRELTEAGMSTRAIAPVVGVSQKTVDRDVRAGESPDSPDVDFAYDDFDSDPSGRWSSVGPGNAGEESCECGFYLSWPEDTTDEDRATMHRLWAEHEATCDSLSDDTGQEVTPFGSRYSVAPEESEVEEPGEAVEATSPEPPARPAVTGLDGKTYTRPEPKTPRRRPLIDAFTGKRWDAQKAVESLARLVEDDRYPQNAEKVATANRSDLIRIKDQLQLVIDALPHI